MFGALLLLISICVAETPIGNGEITVIGRRTNDILIANPAKTGKLDDVDLEGLDEILEV